MPIRSGKQGTTKRSLLGFVLGSVAVQCASSSPRTCVRTDAEARQSVRTGVALSHS